MRLIVFMKNILFLLLLFTSCFDPEPPIIIYRDRSVTEKEASDLRVREQREIFRNGWYKGGNTMLENVNKSMATGRKLKRPDITADSIAFEKWIIK